MVLGFVSFVCLSNLFLNVDPFAKMSSSHLKEK